MDQLIGALVALTVISLATAVTSVINALSSERQLAAALKRNAELVTIRPSEIHVTGTATIQGSRPTQY